MREGDGRNSDCQRANGRSREVEGRTDSRNGNGFEEETARAVRTEQQVQDW